jgi:NifU-like protein involved in Fe-S cluster formation
MSAGSPVDPYNKTVREYFADPQHAGDLPDAPTGYFEDQGIRLRFCAETRKDRVETMRFAAWGCPHVIAAAEAVCRYFEGSAIAELDKFPSAQIITDLAVPVEKTGRILVVEDTVRSLRAAIQDRLSD